MKFSARFIFVFGLLSLVFSFLFVNPSFAQSENPTTSPSPVVQTNPNTTPNTNPDVPKNLHNWTQNVMIEVMLALTCQLVGVDPTQPNGQCLGVDQNTGKIGFLPAGNLEKGQIGGAIGGMNNMITMLYTPPLHTGDYFNYLAGNFGIVKSAHAQTGTGFDSLQPLIKLWSAFRNIVYLIFVLVFIVIGVAIMLRVKIDPRTVMSIQNQIPKIIIGILLVTFSFAIAGFLVDMMWVMTYLVFGLIAGVPGVSADSIKDLSPLALQGKSPLGIGFGEIHSMVNSVAGNSSTMIQHLLGIQATPANIFAGIIDKWTVAFALAMAVGGPLGPLIFIPLMFTDLGSLITNALPSSIPVWGSTSPPAANYFINLISAVGAFLMFHKSLSWDFPSFEALTFGVDLGILGNMPIGIAIGAATFAFLEAFLRFALPYLIVYIIVFFALLIALFRLWFVLLMAYINILIDVVLAPFWIVGSLVPGSPVSATGWLRDLIANLAAFPAVIFMFLLGKVFVDAFTTQPNAFVPPLIGNINPTMLGSLIGIGIILMTPNVVTMVKAAIKAPKFDTGGALKGIGAGASVLGGTTKSSVGAGLTAIMGDPFNPTQKGFGAIFRGWQRRNG